MVQQRALLQARGHRVPPPPKLPPSHRGGLRGHPSALTRPDSAPPTSQESPPARPHRRLHCHSHDLCGPRMESTASAPSLAPGSSRRNPPSSRTTPAPNRTGLALAPPVPTSRHLKAAGGGRHRTRPRSTHPMDLCARSSALHLPRRTRPPRPPHLGHVARRTRLAISTRLSLLQGAPRPQHPTTPQSGPGLPQQSPMSPGPRHDSRMPP